MTNKAAAGAGIALIIGAVLLLLFMLRSPLKKSLENAGDTAEEITQAVKNTATSARITTEFANPASYASVSDFPSVSETDVTGKDTLGINVQKVDSKIIWTWGVPVQRETFLVKVFANGSGIPRANLHLKGTSIIGKNFADGGINGHTDYKGEFEFRTQFPVGTTLGGLDAVEVWATHADYNQSVHVRVD